jgi:hypothetical protein
MSIVNLNLPENFAVVQAWVLDKLVAVQLSNGTFTELAFYERPLVAGDIQDPLTFD